MNPIRLLMFAALLVFSSTAATCSKAGGGGNPVVAGVVNCAEAGVHNAALNLINDVASVIATTDWESALADLVGRFGEGAVDCAVAEISKTSSAHARVDSLEATKARRAKQWLAAHPVTGA